MMAAVNGNAVEQTTVVDGILAEQASAAVDAEGRIHVLLTGSTPTSTWLGSEIYYLRLGASL